MNNLRNYIPILLICFLAINMLSCKQTTKPNAEFKADKRLAMVGDSIKFTNESKNYTRITWNFGDGAASGEINPVHVYKSEGTFYPSVTAEKGDSTSKTDLKIDVIAPHDTIEIADTSSIIAGKEVLLRTRNNSRVIWKVNDEIVKESESINYIFQLPGSYKIEILHPASKILLDARNVDVPSEIIKKDTTVVRTVNVSVWPLRAYTGEDIGFSTNYDKSGIWNFGGNNSSEARSGHVSFPDPGEYIIVYTDKADGKIIKRIPVTILEKVDNVKLSAWLTKLANPISYDEGRDLSNKIVGYCLNYGDVPLTGIESGSFKDFLIKIKMEESKYQVVSITVNIQMNSNHKISSIELVTYDKRKMDN